MPSTAWGWRFRRRPRNPSLGATSRSRISWRTACWFGERAYPGVAEFHNRSTYILQVDHRSRALFMIMMIFSFNKFVPKQAREKFFLNFFFLPMSKVLKFLQKLSSHSHKKKHKKKNERERERGLKAKHHKIHQRELRVCVCVCV